MKKLMFILGFTLFASLSVVFAQPWDTAFYLQRAEQYKLQSDWEKALEFYTNVLNKEPDNVRALNGRGVVYMKRGEYLKAKLDFQRAVAQNPSIAESRHNLEDANARLAEVVIAGETAESAGRETELIISKDYTEASRILGTSEYNIIDLANTESAVKEGGVGQSNNAAEVTGVVVYYNDNPRLPVPSSSATAVNFKPPPPVTAKPVLGNQRTNQDSLASLRLNPAVSAVQKIEPVNPSAYYERVILEYSEAIARNPNFAIAFNNRGVAYAKTGDYTRALEDFNQALRLNPYYYDAQANREQVKSSLTLIQK